MNPSPSNSPDPPNSDERLIELEGLFMHLQRTVHDLDQVVVDQARRIEILERGWKRLNNEVQVVRDSAREPRRPEDEIPPHY